MSRQNLTHFHHPVARRGFSLQRGILQSVTHLQWHSTLRWPLPCWGLQRMACTRTWADAGLDEPTADWSGAGQACGMAFRCKPLVTKGSQALNYWSIWVMWFWLISAMVCSLGECLIHHINRMNTKILLISLLSTLNGILAIIDSGTKKQMFNFAPENCHHYCFGWILINCREAWCP